MVHRLMVKFVTSVPEPNPGRTWSDRVQADNLEALHHAADVTRRTFLGLHGVLILCASPLATSALAQAREIPSLRSAPLELAGVWPSSPPDAVMRVLSRVREVSFADLRLLSDRQPERLRVDDHADGLPAIWLHDDHTRIAWIIVDIGPRDWSKLAYQFGHELGHVLCNSWDANAKPQPPSQWLEEAMVEAFSIRGLGLLAASWERNPPFAGDAPFGAAIRQYRGNLIESYKKAASSNLALWFHKNRNSLENGGGPSQGAGPAVLAILAELERNPGCVEDFGAVNRWPARSKLSIGAYLTAWQASCAEIHSPGRLPVRLKDLLQLR